MIEIGLGIEIGILTENSKKIKKRPKRIRRADAENKGP